MEYGITTDFVAGVTLSRITVRGEMMAMLATKGNRVEDQHNRLEKFLATSPGGVHIPHMVKAAGGKPAMIPDEIIRAARA